MTAEQIAQDCLTQLFGKNVDPSADSVQIVVDVIRAAAVDEAVREDAARTVRQYSDTLMTCIQGAADYQVSQPMPELVRLADRLAFILGLSPMERAFIHDAESSGGRTSWLIFADWLDEQNKPAEALRLRTLFPQPGQVAVLSFPVPRNPDQAHIYRQLGEEFAKRLGCQTFLVYGDQTLDMLNEEDMHRAGWARIPDAEPDLISVDRYPGSSKD